MKNGREGMARNLARGRNEGDVRQLSSEGQKCPLANTEQRDPNLPCASCSDTSPAPLLIWKEKQRWKGKGRAPDALGLKSFRYHEGDVQSPPHQLWGWEELAALEAPRLAVWNCGAEPAGVPEPKKQKPSNFTRAERCFSCLFLIKLSMLTLGLHSTI